MRALFVPTWRENPYLELLASHLESQGVAVRHAGPRRLRHPGRVLRTGIDVVHLHSAERLHRARSAGNAALRALRACAALAWLRVRGVRLVWTVHDLGDHERRHPWIDAAFGFALARLVHVLVAHGETAAARIRERFRLGSSRRIAVVPHGPFDGYAIEGADRASARRRLGWAEAPLVFLFLGAIRPYKGVEDLVAAFRGLADPDWRLVIRGRARDPALAARIAAAAAGDPRIDFVEGFVPDAEVGWWLAACDVFVAPYRRVLTSGSVALAQSLGRPCVAPRLGGLPDAIDADCGWLYAPGDATALRDALRAAGAHRDALPALGARARERAHAVGWDEIARRTRALYGD